EIKVVVIMETIIKVVTQTIFKEEPKMFDLICPQGKWFMLMVRDKRIKLWPISQVFIRKGSRTRK
ncbi:hypothetical protein HAX54_011208, partial [Datura stramonium]|nr:hypothetical protein [Datura stramonium]